VAQKVRTIRLVPGDKPGKMARLIARDTVVGTLEVLECSQLELDAEMHALWERKWGAQTMISYLDTNRAMSCSSGDAIRKGHDPLCGGASACGPEPASALITKHR
jgi:hypothetical protein